ncbi:MAG TPA: YsnF/AvaK domain-containing protein [Allosphingosinicella sp.]
MSRTVTALFDTREEAEAAKSRLQSSNIDTDRIRILDQSSSSSSGAGGQNADGGNKGFFGSLADMFMPDEDRHAYQEGINRGGFMLCAEVDEHEVDQAVNILDESDSVDFDARQEEWRGQGWAGWTGGTMNNQQVGTSSQPAMGMQSPQMQQGQAPQSQAPQAQIQQGLSATGRTVEEERIPLVEEELRVGKREVNRGGARVRSYVRETPVHEQVSLREEHVSVERRPVNEPLARGELDRDSDLLRDRTIEMTEKAEEAVVGKEARVREEVVVRKTAEERNEQIDDTVRRTEVDVQEGSADRSPSAFGFDDDRSATRSSAEFENSSDPARRP